MTLPLSTPLIMDGAGLPQDQPQGLAILQPRLTCSVRVEGNQIFLVQGQQEVQLLATGQLAQVLRWMDGRHSLQVLQQRFFPQESHSLEQLIAELHQWGFVQEGTADRAAGSLWVYQTLQQLAQDLLGQDQLLSQFWSRIDRHPPVLYGYAIEIYQILWRLSQWYTPALGTQGNLPIQRYLQSGFVQMSGQDQLWLTALEAAGFESQDLANRLPLPYTVALCQSLNYWARGDRTLFLNALGLGWQHLQAQLPHYAQACADAHLPPGFLQGLQGAISAQQQLLLPIDRCFEALASIPSQTQMQLQGQTHVLVEMCSQFYQTLADHYSTVDSPFSMLGGTP